ncbi:HNH endonuclease [Gulosibacter faecalis]|uniref:DUF222 domain-containing protein n=1 Tax=Gulosibacter faecalis TaxID=272240 RepID=A0ABW5UY65_9MICO
MANDDVTGDGGDWAAPGVPHEPTVDEPRTESVGSSSVDWDALTRPRRGVEFRPVGEALEPPICDRSGAPEPRDLRALPNLADLPDGELMRALEAHGAEVRAVHARAAALSRELAKRSAKSLGRDALSKRAGYANSTIAAAHLLGVPYNFARQLHSVGEATSTRITLQGEVLPPRYEHVADSVAGAVLPVEYADKIVEFLEDITPRVDPVTLVEAEVALVEAAPGLTSRELVQVIAGMTSVLDPDGVEPTEAEAYAGRYFDMTVLPTGQVRIKGLLDAASAAPILAGVNAYVTNELRKSRGVNNPDGSVTGVVRDVDRDRTEGQAQSESEVAQIVQETRTVRQLRADAFIMLCQHAIGCNELPGCSTQVVVRMQDRDLIDRARDAGLLDDVDAADEPVDEATGLDPRSAFTSAGLATIDGLPAAISASAARRLCAKAGIIPVVLGGAGEVLDLGRASRLATPAQRKALIERDGGCAFCGLEPSMCEVHHVRYWTRDAGPTDLANLILLCTTCHHRIHDDEWQIRIVPPGTADQYQGPARPARFSVLDEVWFIPPASVYPDRTPRLGGRRRYAPKVRTRC